MYMNQGGQNNYGNNNFHQKINQDPGLALVNPNSPQLQDSIQEISWYPLPNNYIFGCATWEGSIRFYSFIIGNNGTYGVDFVQAINVMDPAICCTFSPDGTKFYSGLANGLLIEIDIQTKNVRQIGLHDLGIRNIFWHNQSNMIISVGLDKYIRFWDVNQPSARPQFEYKSDNIPILAAMHNNNFMFADNEQKIWTTDWEKLRNQQSTSTKYLFESSVNLLGERSQVTALSLSQSHIATGTIDGRVNIQEIQKYKNNHVITFKAHKTEESVGQYSTTKRQTMWSVNNIELNPVRAPQNWVSTTGSNGELILWDFKEKNKIKVINLQGCPTASKLSPDGMVIAYGIGYDWNKGCEQLGKYQNNVGAYVVQNQDLYFR